jgi:hypothetical protein
MLAPRWVVVTLILSGLLQGCGSGDWNAQEAACDPSQGSSSSLSACGPHQPCSNAAEKCFSTAACGPPPGGCQTAETGDLKCHLSCLDDTSCAQNERCVAAVIFEPPQGTDVPTSTHLCLAR